MASERVERAITYLRTGRRDLGPLREIGLTADEYNDVLAGVRWGYETSTAMQAVVQNLYGQKRADEAAPTAGRRPEGRRRRYGPWEIDRELSPGGQANTFLVREEGTADGRLCVLKVLKNPKRLGRFRDEIQAATRLDHPNIVRVVDSDLTGERPYLVTEYCEGGTLEDLDVKALSIAERLRIFLAICRGVAHAHDGGIIHRDIKPANIFMPGDRRTPVVGDFGLCFLADADERHTRADEVVGARWYTAPELEDGRSDHVGPWCDVYSLSKVLYRMMGGRIFNREKHRDAGYDLTRGADSSDMSFVYDVLDRGVVADHGRRFQTVHDLARAVEVAVTRIEAGAHVLDLDVPQLCDFCALGNYRPVATTTGGGATVRNFGLSPAGETDLVILACDHCGNVQMFRRDLGKKGAWKAR